MPITLGCPSCGKRFRARDESAGKRVKCPYCQAAVPVPSADEAAAAGAPTDVVSSDPDPFRPTGSGAVPFSPPIPVPPRPSGTVAGSQARPVPPSRPVPPPPAPVAASDEWGGGLDIVEEPQPLSSAQPMSRPRPGRPEPEAPPQEAQRPPRGKPPGGRRPPPRKDTTEQNPDQVAAGGWRKAKGGLCWVLIGLFFIALPGFVPFAKAVYERSVGELPGKEPGWVKIEGVVNTGEAGTIRTTQAEEVTVAAYGIPLVLAGFFLTIGRLTAGAAPADSGTRGLFAFSGMFTLLAVTALVAYVACDKYGFKTEAGYAKYGYTFGGAIAEFWFLVALGAAAGNLKRPKAVRTVGLLALFIGLGAICYTIGWDEYTKFRDAELKKLTETEREETTPLFRLGEGAAIMLGWLILIGTYWRAVKSTRLGMRKWLEEYEVRKDKAGVA